MHEIKACERCSATFQRNLKYSTAQWSAQRFCSHRCASIVVGTPHLINAPRRPKGYKGTPRAGIKHRRTTTRYAELKSPRQRNASGQTEYRAVVSAALGHELRVSAPVHHVDLNPRNNNPSNLVACHDAAYHNMLHRRQRALDACGHADWLLCRHCKQYDAPENLTVYNCRVGRSHLAAFHLSCAAKAVAAVSKDRYISRALRRLIYARDGHRCVNCGATDRLSIDHVTPFSEGGTNDPSNLRTLCLPCNWRRGNRPVSRDSAREVA